MDKDAQIDLHTASVVLKRSFNFTISTYLIHSAYYAVTCRKTSVAAAEILALCPWTMGRP